MDITADEYLKRYDNIIAEARRISKDKSMLYGVSSIGELGAAGEFVQVHRKYKRLKNLVWENDPENLEVSGIYRDTLRDTLLDMINYCIIMLIVLEGDKD